MAKARQDYLLANGESRVHLLGPYEPKKPRRPRVKTEQTQELVEEWLRALQDPARPLTDWELGFLDSITKQFEERGKLSARQFEVLERIYASKTA